MRQTPKKTDPEAAGGGADPSELCVLPADGLAGRLAWIREEILPHAIKRERGADAIAWELEDVPGLAARLDRLVTLERECCSGLVFEHGASATAGRLRLEVRGVDPDAPVFASLEGWAPGRDRDESS